MVENLFTKKMQKINFHQLLMPSVLDGSKTMTRRVAYNGEIAKPNSGFFIEDKDKGKACLSDGNFIVAKSRYAVDEVVAIAQSYKSLGYDIADLALGAHAGWNNKLYVCAGFMPHQIRITDIKVERLQDISDEDCIKEGVYTQDIWSDIDYCFGNICFENAQEAFRYMLSECCKPKTLWDDNPWVFAYSYELVK